METDKITELNEKLERQFGKLKLIYIIFLMEPFLLFGIVTAAIYLFGQNLSVIAGIGAISRSFVRTISFIFIILSVVEYYSIVILIKKRNSIIGRVGNIEEFYGRYTGNFLLLLSVASTPSLFGAVYLLLSKDMVMTVLFFLISLISILRVLPRYKAYRDLYIDLSEEDI